MAAARTIHVRCATWEQVDLFLTRKLRKGRLLSMRVPFAAVAGARVTLGLELPSQVVVAIDGSVVRTSPVEDGVGTSGVGTSGVGTSGVGTSGVGTARTWIEVELTGLTDDVLARIKGLSSGVQEVVARESSAPLRRATTLLPPEELPDDERALFQHLSGELRRLRQAAVHEVLGVNADAGLDDVRAGWKALVRRVHPDLVARRGAPAISHLAEELTILSNRAYDRLRAALVADGVATVVGPSLAPPTGWIVGFDDIPSGDVAIPTPAAPPKRFGRAQSPVPMASPPRTSAEPGSDAFEQRARALLGQGDAANAREILAAALVVHPRSRPLRSLYYVASALAALQAGEVVLAESQLETALAHHDQCVEAARMLDHVRKHGARATDMLRVVFQ